MNDQRNLRAHVTDYLEEQGGKAWSEDVQSYVEYKGLDAGYDEMKQMAENDSKIIYDAGRELFEINEGSGFLDGLTSKENVKKEAPATIIGEFLNSVF